MPEKRGSFLHPSSWSYCLGSTKGDTENKFKFRIGASICLESEFETVWERQAKEKKRKPKTITTSGVRTHADLRPLELKSNALTTRPSCSQPGSCKFSHINAQAPRALFTQQARERCEFCLEKHTEIERI